jgi:hypothetical protein
VLFTFFFLLRARHTQQKAEQHEKNGQMKEKNIRTKAVTHHHWR